MIDPTQAEIDAMVEAANYGGQYLDSIGKSDLAKLTNDEWMTFIEAVCTGFTDTMAKAPAV